MGRSWFTAKHIAFGRFRDGFQSCRAFFSDISDADLDVLSSGTAWVYDFRRRDSMGRDYRNAMPMTRRVDVLCAILALNSE